jgi:hypothetical protein
VIRGLFLYFLFVPKREAGSCLDPELPETGLQERGEKGTAHPVLVKESVGTQQRWGKHEKKWRRTHSGHDEEGSAANGVRKKIVTINNTE